MVGETKPKDSIIVVVIGIITLVLALIAAVALLTGPAAYTLLLSLKDFKISAGLMHSPWIGLQNFLFLLKTPGFTNSLLWTVAHSLLTALFTLLLSLLTGYLLLAAGRIRWLRHALCTLLLIPLLIPGELWAAYFIKLRLYTVFGSDAMLNGILVAAWCSLKYIGLPALLTTAALSHGKRSWGVPPLSGGVASLAVFALLGRFDFSFTRYLPPTMYSILGLDNLSFRMFFMQMQIGPAAAVNTVSIIISCVMLAIVAVPVALMVRKLFPQGLKADIAGMKDRLISLAVPGAAVLIAAAALAAVVLGSGFNANGFKQYANYPIYIVLALCTAAASTVLCYLLARPVACSGKAGKIGMTAVLVVLTAIGSGAVPLGEYLIFHSARVVDSLFAVALSGIGAIWGVWPLLFAAKGMGVGNSTDWFKRMWKPSLALFGVQAAFQMNNTLPAYMYIRHMNLQHPLVNMMQAIQNSQMLSSLPGQAGGLSYLLMLLAVMAFPVALLLIIRTVFTEKESLGLFLPGR
jgi:hypothetical protein